MPEVKKSSEPSSNRTDSARAQATTIAPATVVKPDHVRALPLTPAPTEPKKEMAEALTFPASGRTIDRFAHAVIARMTFGTSPASALLTYLDWAAHLAIAPGKQTELAQKAWRKALRYWIWAVRASAPTDGEPCIEPLPQDRRFRGEDWQKPPFNMIYQWFLLQQQWWYNAATGVPGVTPQKEKALEFMSRQILDMMSPSNFLWTNPEVLKATASHAGFNLLRGGLNFIEDWERDVAGRKPIGTENFVVGRDVGITPGKVIFRNRLMELIQYTPTTETVYAEPILIVPACIMKYYILDLSPHNSMVKYLVDQGHTVFIISWKNPVAEDRDLSMGDYRRMGIRSALRVIESVVPDRLVHTVGYCLGGILLATEAAAMARDDEDGIGSMTLFTTELDFSEPGEMQLFLDESQVSFLEDTMWDQGYLDGKQFAGAFQMLRSRDLIWSRMVREYLLGERQVMNDLMAWNADQTRSPSTMHSELLRSLFLNNDLAEGRYRVDGRPVVIADIRVPIFSVAASKDHIVPWQAVYKINLLTDTDVTFVLTKGGHNAGVVSEPGHKGRHYQVGTKIEGTRHIDAETWRQTMPVREGSWWPEWQRWLAERSSDRVAPPSMGAPDRGYPILADAPGNYVFQE